MNRKRLRSQHKWLGLIAGVLLMLFCLSGVVLNHRQLFADINVSRGILPSTYGYHNWNNGLLRGTITLKDSTILIYGKGGIFEIPHDKSISLPPLWGRVGERGASHSTAKAYPSLPLGGGLGRGALTAGEMALEGFPKGADYRSISKIIQTRKGDVYAAAQFGLYKRFMVVLPATDDPMSAGVLTPYWMHVPLYLEDGDRLTDITARGDSVIVLSRSKVYLAVGNDHFKAYTIMAPEGGLQKTMFRFLWQLHSGELFGLPGKLIVDAIAIIFVILFITGLFMWLLPKRIKAVNKVNKDNKETKLQRLRKSLKHHWQYHNKIGRYTIILTALIALTGAFLRPPLLIAISKLTVPTIGSNDNAWEDKLRMLQWDDQCADWLLSTSEGFYTMKHLTDVPQKVTNQPPVSIMGINVLKHEKDGSWLVGSFSGLYKWIRHSNTVINAVTGEPVTEKPLPFGNLAISGYSDDFAVPFYCTYYEGTDAIPQPDKLTNLPMSLWNLALEVHTGRIFTFLGTLGSFLYIFIISILTIWLLITGYRLYPTHHKTNHSSTPPAQR